MSSTQAGASLRKRARIDDIPGRADEEQERREEAHDRDWLRHPVHTSLQVAEASPVLPTG